MVRAYLLTIELCQSGQLVSFSQERLRLGAGPACTLRLEGAAPEHAEVWLEEGAVKLRDLGSSAGTYVNDIRVVGDVVVAAEDVVRLGPARVRIARRSREDVVRRTWEGAYGDLGERSVLRQDQTLSSRVTLDQDDLGQRATLQPDPTLSGQPTLGNQAIAREGTLGGRVTLDPDPTLSDQPTLENQAIPREGTLGGRPTLQPGPTRSRGTTSGSLPDPGTHTPNGSGPV